MNNLDLVVWHESLEDESSDNTGNEFSEQGDCSECFGLGYNPSPSHRCPKCDGTGREASREG